MNDEFLKFHSIENTYQTIFIEKAVNYYPELEKCKYILTEKIHGCNMQVAFIPVVANGHHGIQMKFGRRRAWLDKGEKFNGMIPRFNEMINTGQFNHMAFGKLALATNSVVRLYGEFFGDGIGKGIEYDLGKKFRFFRYSVDGVMATPWEFYRFMNDIGNSALASPIRYMADGIDEALAFDVETLITILGPWRKDNFAEGVVISPYAENFELPSGKTFVLKKKHSKFAEIKNTPKERKPLDSDVEHLRKCFRAYVTDNRLQNVFSKEGKPEEAKDIGKFVKFLIEDAREDFLKDYGDEIAKIDKSKHKQIYNTGPVPAQLIKEYL